METNFFDFYVEGERNSFWNVKLLSKSMQYKEVKKEAYQNAKDKYQNELYRSYDYFISNELKSLDILGLYKPDIEVKNLPRYSLLIQFKFKLKKPFYSNDDDDFYIIENSITKEHVFKIPMIRASSWKGNLRNTIIKINQIDKNPEDSNIIKRLFGYTTETGKNQKKGRLIFYPTYFDQIGLEIIAPHDRNSKTVKNPILYEVVPKGGSGFFSLFYIPFDLIGVENPNLEEIKEDYNQISNAIKKMMTTYGFGAKTSSGYGVVEDEIDCIVNISPYKLSAFDDMQKMIEGGLS
ncbi:DUF324 domain containing Cmr2-like protein [Methanosarcina barkeri 3]|uniref:DUF324 domain containing Cmr2-like protein n=1 Tax=Methanosarcina barkeri 3 TaxID=1434107 RepID=A0A0E3WV99_METBA|nr:RAMP superfamily CRISPR-associated protein [Methanosarcina barkeri]AKB80720.1 DUF324 domain containing Cmr2-like protein [Methanosarcina barkeri 3]